MRGKIREKEFLTELEVESLGFRSASALRNDRCKKRNLFPFHKVGRRVLYKKKDILDVVERCRKE